MDNSQHNTTDPTAESPSFVELHNLLARAIGVRWAKPFFGVVRPLNALGKMLDVFDSSE
jgi:hypothetical protein